ncbi:MAG: anhydro-N-acetylmuramic acid kinase [Gammaproteobacteria bacterium]
MMDHYIGLMSGTSFDGIDAVIVSFEDEGLRLHAHCYMPYEPSLQEQLLLLSEPNSPHTLETVFTLDALLGERNAAAVLKVIEKAEMKPMQIRAIGFHGQTLRHYPNNNPAFTVQLGDPNRLVAATGIPTVGDFRRKDIALHGQGAPLAPLFHQVFFASPTEERAIVNIGGFSNISLLQQDRVWGFDTGPGNVFIDALARKYLHMPFDENGDCARSGHVHEAALKALLTHPFFQMIPPKSTGRDVFSDEWFEKTTTALEGQPKEVWLATLTELTAKTISDAIINAAPSVEAVYVCGGGASNVYLMERLQAHLPKQRVDKTLALGVAAEHTEACLMAWLAKQRILEIPVDLRSITGSREATVLGGLYI